MILPNKIMKDIINFDSRSDGHNAFQCNLDDHKEITTQRMWINADTFNVALNSASLIGLNDFHVQRL